MVNTLQGIDQRVWSLILAGFAYVDEALAYWEGRLHDYAADLERRRLIAELEKIQDDMLEVIEELHELETVRGQLRRSARPAPAHSDYHDDDDPIDDCIGINNKGARDEMEQAGHSW